MAEATKTTVTEETVESGSDERTEVRKTTEVRQDRSDEVYETPKRSVTETTTTTTTEED